MAFSDPPAEDFGRRLKRLAKEKGYTGRALAKLTGAHEVTVSRWMAGSEPGIDTLLILAELFGVSVPELRRGREENHATPAQFKKELKRPFKTPAKKRRKGNG